VIFKIELKKVDLKTRKLEFGQKNKKMENK